MPILHAEASMPTDLKVLLENLQKKTAILATKLQSEASNEFSDALIELQELAAKANQTLKSANTEYAPHLKPDQKSPERNLSRRVNELDLSVRSSSMLRRKGIQYVGDLIKLTESELMKTKNFGKKSLSEIKEQLKGMGLSLGMNASEWTHGQIEGLQIVQKEATFLDQNSNISEPKFIHLLRKVDELDFSVRAGNVFKNKGIRYVGDLINLTETQLTDTKNFGRTSLSEIKEKLKGMGLSLGMSVVGWPPNQIEELHIRYRDDLESLRNQEAKREIDYNQSRISSLEDELFQCLGKSIVSERNARIVCAIFGWDGRGPRTLQSVGTEFRMTRERVRQIRNNFLARFAKKRERITANLRFFDAALKVIDERLPVAAHQVENALVREKVSRNPFRVDGLLATSKLLNRKLPFLIVKQGQQRLLIRPQARRIPKLILHLINKSIEHWGVATFADILEQVKHETPEVVDEHLTLAVIDQVKHLHWLDSSGGWFWIASVARNRLINQIKKILSVSGAIDVVDLRSGVGRHHRMEGFSPPSHILLEFCKQAPFCRVEGNTVIADPPLTCDEILDTTERTMAAILKEYGPIMSRVDYQKKCVGRGIKESTFFAYLRYSPIITKYAVGVYGLRGSKVQPGAVESLKPKRTPERSLIDFGWTTDGRIWIGRKITTNLMETGVLSIPTAMSQFLQGDFTFKAADGAQLGNLTIKDVSGWTLKPFFRRRGGEAGDFVVLIFDVGSHEVKGFIGDAELLEEFGSSGLEVSAIQSCSPSLDPSEV
jgi:DNA-directed RNA polymerase alpha subunit